MRRILIFALGVVAVGAIMWVYSLRGTPVLNSFGSNIEDERGFMLLNPFRDRQPEQKAIAALQMLKSGQCMKLASSMNVTEWGKHDICGHETRIPLRSWILSGREDSNGSVHLRYSARRENLQDRDTIWINVNYVDGKWKVKTMEFLY